MIKYSSCILFILFSFHLKAQDNQYLELCVDSIERKILKNRWSIDTFYFAHFRVENRTKDTLYYTTNSCFYYNHYAMKINEFHFDINPEGGCICNITKTHEIPPYKSILREEWITANGLEQLQLGKLNILFSIPLIEDNPNEFRVYANHSLKNTFLLNYDGIIKMTSTTIDNRRKKRAK